MDKRFCLKTNCWNKPVLMGLCSKHDKSRDIGDLAVRPFDVETKADINATWEDVTRYESLSGAEKVRIFMFLESRMREIRKESKEEEAQAKATAPTQPPTAAPSSKTHVTQTPLQVVNLR